jgi:formylmethanofuran dehydrogenase subunit E
VKDVTTTGKPERDEPTTTRGPRAPRSGEQDTFPAPLATAPARIGDLTFEEYVDRVRLFHGYAAPGVLIGGFMVDLARSLLPAGTLFQAICETRVCLPDAVQLLTPCTLGNGRLHTFPVGRFALALYDKTTGAGFRVWVDAGRLEPFPEIRAWFLKTKGKAEQDPDLLQLEIAEAGGAILGVRRVQVAAAFLRKHKLGNVGLCPVCGESYPMAQGDRCGGCRGELPYTDSLDS